MGCSKNIPTPVQRLETASTLAQELNKQIFHTQTFDIFSYQKTLTCKDEMSVYIEGDGLAWITSSILSTDPTPLNPVALKLMVQDDATCKVYLARPCHYIQNKNCDKKYWSSHRFAPVVIQSYREILEELKQKYHIQKFKLYGFSGGGTVAALLSAQRDDIEQLITIAGNLDIDFWTKKNYLTPLQGSLNPVDFSKQLSKIKQIHLIGSADTIIDKSIYNAYIKHFDNTQNIRYLVFKGFTHTCCWDKKWKDLLRDMDSF